MNSIEEIKEFIYNADAGEAVYRIDLHYGDLRMDMGRWQFKEDLKHDNSYWLNHEISYALSRSFNGKSMELVNPDYSYKRVIEHINICVLDVFYKTSPAEQPRRTKAYKSMNKVKSQNRSSEAFAREALPILNYYFKTKTDENESHNREVHKNNTYALLDILRKKYDTSS